MRFLSGYPGDHFIVARRSGDRWYVAGLNGTGEAADYALDLGWLGGKTATFLGNGGDGSAPSFRQETVTLPAAGTWSVKLAPRDGFVMVVE